VIQYIESKYEEFLNAESRVVRRQIADSRVHCCLYFVAPSGHGLKPLDVEFMHRLHDKVNIIPVIAKADTMTPDECVYFKKQVRVPIWRDLDWTDLSRLAGHFSSPPLWPAFYQIPLGNVPLTYKYLSSRRSVSFALFIAS
jgi:hypothetical protein